jgi:cold-inducible RNA-binding protein
MTKLYVGQLGAEISSDELRQLFAAQGFIVTSARVICDREGGRSRGFGFVELGSLEEARRAVEDLNGIDIRGRKILVKEARPQEPRDGRGNGTGHHKQTTNTTGA